MRSHIRAVQSPAGSVRLREARAFINAFAPGDEVLLLGASRGEGGILGEGIRAALLRDPTYAPALRAAQAMLPEETHADAVAA